MSARPKAYVETSVVSYLTAWPSRDLVRAAHQQVTREWWATRGNYDLYVSQFVLDEAAAGDSTAAEQRLEALQGIALLDVTEEAIVLAGNLVAGGGLPGEGPRRRASRRHGNSPWDGLPPHLGTSANACRSHRSRDSRHPRGHFKGVRR